MPNMGAAATLTLFHRLYTKCSQTWPRLHGEGHERKGVVWLRHPHSWQHHRQLIQAWWEHLNGRACLLVIKRIKQHITNSWVKQTWGVSLWAMSSISFSALGTWLDLFPNSLTNSFACWRVTKIELRSLDRPDRTKKHIHDFTVLSSTFKATIRSSFVLYGYQKRQFVWIYFKQQKIQPGKANKMTKISKSIPNLTKMMLQQ